MNRRSTLKLLSTAPLAGRLISATAGSGLLPVAIYDGRFKEARVLRYRSSQSFDCQRDAAGLWFARLSSASPPIQFAHGLTTQADAMVFADCARREGLHLRQTSPPRTDGLVAWVIERK